MDSMKNSRYSLRSIKEVNGDGCFLVKLLVKSLNDIEEFINDISSYAITETIIAFSEVTINNSINKFLEE